ncbi:uncharacterized protein LOC117882239 isoform X4 [Trachemys scripta elegans]|uniref:uncharacterized protein LOC117882239 isoform X4 n=1 Tax=Trachemys scripta elegans TaxID=31138 RepID=UPI00155441DB|nr:uncharacterized protein LOC117882239 isoform X4 [Trachemys scripta elegans]
MRRMAEDVAAPHWLPSSACDSTSSGWCEWGVGEATSRLQPAAQPRDYGRSGPRNSAFCCARVSPQCSWGAGSHGARHKAVQLPPEAGRERPVQVHGGDPGRQEGVPHTPEVSPQPGGHQRLPGTCRLLCCLLALRSLPWPGTRQAQLRPCSRAMCLANLIWVWMHSQGPRARKGHRSF